MRILPLLFLVACATPDEAATTQHLEDPPRCEDLGCGVWDVDDLGCVAPWAPQTVANCTCSVDTGERTPCHYP